MRDGGAMKLCFWKKDSHKYYVILLSYLLLLLIPIVCGGFLHIYNQKLVTEQSEEMTEHMLASISDQTDGYIDNIWQMAIGISRLNSIDTVLHEDKYDRKKIAYGLYCVEKDIDTFYSFDNFVKDVFVYFKEIDKIAGRCGVTSPEDYAAVFLGGAITGDMLREQLQTFPYKDYVKMENVRGGNDIWCLLSDPEQVRTKDSQYTIVVVFEDTALRKQLESFRWTDEITVMIQDNREQILCSTSDSAMESQYHIINGIEDAESGYQSIQVDNEPYVAMVKASLKNKWRYYMLIPENVLYGNAKEMQKYYLFMLFSCIVIGFFTARILSKKYYHPIKLLSELILKFKTQGNMQNGAKEQEKDKNSYEWLQEQVDYFFKERVNTIQLLKRNRRELRNYYLLCLLENSYTKDLEENLQKNQIVFAYSHFMAVQFLIVEEQFSAEEYALAQFVIQNIFTELIEEQEMMTVYMVHVGERMVGIINFEAREQLGKVYQVIQEGQEIIERNFHYEVTALLGGSYDSEMEIFKSYEDSCEAEEYIYLLDETLICYEDICVRKRKYRYNVELEQKLFQAVKDGKEREAKQWIHVLFEQYVPEDMSLDIYRCLLFDIMGTILKAADASGYQNVTEENHLAEQLVVKMNPAKLEKKFGELVENICKKIEEMHQNDDGDKRLSKMVQAFIQENFRNPDINVSLTGQHFHMAPSYLSALYKKQTGKSLLEYLNQARLEEAERLLEGGMSVTEVAKQAGFRDSTYLIRVFKKKYGVTPGQKKQKW